MRILVIGDVSASGGLAVLERALPPYLRQNPMDLVIVNGENASMRGITPQQAELIFDCGADVITLGNHTFAQRQICNYLEDMPYILRPANLPPQLEGKGFCHIEVCGRDVCVCNLLGRLNMGDFRYGDPFAEADRILKNEKDQTDLFIFDFHAEATSEKKAFGYHVDGRAGICFGTHTHVQTADEHILPGGCGYITDIGMTGALESVIGVKYQQSVSYFRGNLGPRFESSDLDCAICGALFEIDEATCKCVHVERLIIR